MVALAGYALLTRIQGENGKVACDSLRVCFSSLDDLLDTPMNRRNHLWSLSLLPYGSPARTMWKILDSRASPREAQPQKSESFREVDIFGAMDTNPTMK